VPALFCAKSFQLPPHFYPVGTSPAPALPAGCPTTITVFDREAPVILCPANLILPANSPAGATVSYPLPEAHDNCSVVQEFCTVASGSNFSVGSTTVACTARDGSPPFVPSLNETTCQFTVNVLDADLSIAGAGIAVITAGVLVTVTLSVRNDGPTEAPGITVTDVLPTGFWASRFVAPSDLAATCDGTTTVTCHFAKALASGAGATIEITATGNLPPGSVTALMSTAAVEAAAPDFNRTNNSAVIAVPVSVPSPALSP
jgi:uncharacterized repeat protein (TIGR01451 family)